MISISSNCVGVVKLCSLFNACEYSFYSHSSLLIEMIIKCILVSLYMLAMSFCIFMV